MKKGLCLLRGIGNIAIVIVTLPISIPFLFLLARTMDADDKNKKEFFKSHHLCNKCKEPLYCHYREGFFPSEWGSWTFVCFNPGCERYEKGFFYVVDPSNGQRQGGIDEEHPLIIGKDTVTIRKEA